MRDGSSFTSKQQTPENKVGPYDTLLEVGRVGNFAGCRIRVPGRYYRPNPGSCRIRVCNMWRVTLLFCVVPPLFKEVPSRMTVKVTETYTRHQAVMPTFILKCNNWKIFKNSKAHYMHKRVHLSQVLHCNFVPIFYRFPDITIYGSKKSPFTHASLRGVVSDSNVLCSAWLWYNKKHEQDVIQ